MNAFAFAPTPLETGTEPNEHRLALPEWLLTRRGVGLEHRPEVVARILAAIPTLVVQGTKFVLCRAPTPEEITALTAVARHYGCAFAPAVRDADAYAAASRLARARRNGRST